MKNGQNSSLLRKRGFLFFTLLILLPVVLMGCSQVNILRPANNATFTLGQTVDFEGEITRSTETGGADRSNDLSWSSSIDGSLGTGRTLTSNRLSVGSHSIIAEWPSNNRRDSISIRVNP